MGTGVGPRDSASPGPRDRCEHGRYRGGEILSSPVSSHNERGCMPSTAAGDLAHVRCSPVPRSWKALRGDQPGLTIG